MYNNMIHVVILGNFEENGRHVIMHALLVVLLYTLTTTNDRIGINGVYQYSVAL